jgi:hypothetical protein
MPLDYQQVRQQIIAMGREAPERARTLQNLRAAARQAMDEHADQSEVLRDKVGAAQHFNPNLRCALPSKEGLNHRNPLPPLPGSITLIAADGSQINPDRHAFVDYCLVNVGAIQMKLGSSDPPTTSIRSQLLYDDQMYTEAGRMTEPLVALRRDLHERKLLADLAQNAAPPVLTLTDGPLELWVGQESGQNAVPYERTFKQYLEALEQLHTCGAITAGYIDRPRGDLLVRLLEIALLPLDQLEHAGQRTHRRFLGITDSDLFRDILEPGERSAIFGIQTRNTDKYAGHLALNFFYLNVGTGRGEKSYPVRVEIPAWVAEKPETLDPVQAVLVQQCRILGTRTYPYLLHRSHEIAVVTLDEKAQLERMIALELAKQGFPPGEASQKQATKDLAGRTRM